MPYWRTVQHSVFTRGNAYLHASCYYSHYTCISPMYLLDSRELSCKCCGISRELVAFVRYCGLVISRAIIQYLVWTCEIALIFSLRISYSSSHIHGRCIDTGATEGESNLSTFLITINTFRQTEIQLWFRRLAMYLSEATHEQLQHYLSIHRWLCVYSITIKPFAEELRRQDSHT